MTSKRNHALLGTVLLVVSGYSAAGASNEESTTDLRAPVVVTGAASTDREIRAEVMKRIDQNLTLGTELIDVQSFDHDVYLYGAVDSFMEGEEAEAIAQAVPGVRKVYNGLGWLGV